MKTTKQSELIAPKNNGGQAFPSAVLFDQGIVDNKGMTLHDWYCGMALQAVLGSTNSLTISEQVEMVEKLGGVESFPRIVAQAANIYADAMIAVREERIAK